MTVQLWEERSWSNVPQVPVPDVKTAERTVQGSVAGWAIPYIIFASSVGVNASLWTSALTRFIKLLPVALVYPKCNKCTFVFMHSQWNLVFHQLLHSKTPNQ